MAKQTQIKKAKKAKAGADIKLAGNVVGRIVGPADFQALCQRVLDDESLDDEPKEGDSRYCFDSLNNTDDGDEIFDKRGRNDWLVSKWQSDAKQDAEFDATLEGATRATMELLYERLYKHAALQEPSSSYGVKLRVSCIREGCHGVVPVHEDIQVLEHDESPEQLGTARCTVCNHEYGISLGVQHMEECTDEESGDILEEE